MAFTSNMRKAARRHLEAAETLPASRRDVAGYLYGIATECAIKMMMVESGIRVDSIFYSHFPELRTMLREAIQGRRAQSLWNMISSDAFMNHWHIAMRYSDGTEIEAAWVNSWAEQARRAVNTMGT